MEIITEFLQQDIPSLILGLFLIMAGVITMAEIIAKFSEIIGKPVKWVNGKNIDHSLTEQNTKAIQELTEQQKTNVKQSIEHDHKIEDQLFTFMEEMKTEMKQFADNRIHDREQSSKIQKELTDSIKSIMHNNAMKEKQIDRLMVAQREVMADRINQKYKYYISIEGIPEDEVEEFTNLHIAYKECGGNHSGDAKYEYCMNHLPVIPVETKLIINKKQ